MGFRVSPRGARAFSGAAPPALPPAEREFFIDNLLVRIHFVIVMIRWTGLAPWEIEFPFPGSLTSKFLACGLHVGVWALRASTDAR